MPPTLDSPLAARSLLITGGSGTFGKAFARRALKDGARRVVIFSRDELKQAQMRAEFPDERMRFFVGDVRDPSRLHLAMRDVDTVIHAAAMKRIDTCEAEPTEAIATNILGTQHVARACIANGIERAVFLSTDKAPAAHTLYGGTKFVAERLWLQSNVYSAGTSTRFSATRYGNVLASRGSVLEIWRNEIAANQPLTITSETCSRFWMTIAQAVDLVCVALRDMIGGEVFVPKVPSAPVLQLARAAAERLTPRYEPGHRCTGLRPGEREHETLISTDEARTTYDLGTHYVIEPESRTWGGQVPPRVIGRVPSGFSYRSDTNPDQSTVGQLRELIFA